jgi:hypothetical protein
MNSNYTGLYILIMDLFDELGSYTMYNSLLMGTEWNLSCQDWLLVILTGKISRWYGSGMSLLTRYLSLLFCTTVDHFAPWHHCTCKTFLAPPFYSLCQCPWCPHFSHNPTEWWVQPFGFSSISVLIWHLDHQEYTSKYLWSSKMIFCVLVDELAMKHKHITIWPRSSSFTPCASPFAGRQLAICTESQEAEWVVNDFHSHFFRSIQLYLLPPMNHSPEAIEILKHTPHNT